MAKVEGFHRFFASIQLAEVTYQVARSAARLRAATGISMPDAIVVGTAIELGADIIATNDRGWPTSLAGEIGALRIIQLGDFAA